MRKPAFLPSEAFEEYAKAFPLHFVPDEGLMIKRIDLIRQLRGWTKKTLATKIGSWAKGRESLALTHGSPVRKVIRASLVLGVSLDYLLGRTYLDDSVVQTDKPEPLGKPTFPLPKPVLFATTDEADRFLNVHSKGYTKKNFAHPS